MGPFIRSLPVFALACGALLAQSSGPQFYTLEKEIALGKQLAEDTRKRAESIANAEVQHYADRVGRRLIAQIKTPFPWSFEVVAGLPDNPTHEPVELPGGFIFIPAGLLLAAHDEDEFAGTLAHAISHVANRHLTKSALSGQIANAGTIPLVFVGGWQNGLAVPKAIFEAQKRFEADADVAAAGIMSAAGYDPRALERYISRVQPETISNRWPFPQRDLRVTALESAIRDLGSADFVAVQQAVQQHVREQVGEPAARKIPSLYR